MLLIASKEFKIPKTFIALFCAMFILLLIPIVEPHGLLPPNELKTLFAQVLNTPLLKSSGLNVFISPK